MRKIACLFVALLLCMSMAVPAFAAENAFVPSIPEKDGPEFSYGEDEEGKPTIGMIVDNDDKLVDHIYEGCLIITSIAKVKDSDKIPEDARQELLKVYEQLKDGSMKVPYDKISTDLDPDKMVIRELVDLSWLCDEHDEMLDGEGNSLKLTFKMGVESGTDVYVMTFVDGEWKPIKSVVNNGDGTITCVFEEICPVLFAVERDGEAVPPQTGDNANLTLWIVVLAVSVAAMAAVLIYRGKASQKSR